MSQKRSGNENSSIQQQKKLKLNDSTTTEIEIKFTSSEFLKTKMKIGDKSA